MRAAGKKRTERWCGLVLALLLAAIAAWVRAEDAPKMQEPADSKAFGAAYKISDKGK